MGNAEQTPEPMMTGRSCTKEAGRLSEARLLMLSGKRSMRNGPRGHQRSFPSGLVRDQARKLVMLRLLRRRKRKKRKSKSYVLDKSTFDLPKHLWIFNLLKKGLHSFCSCVPESPSFSEQERRSSTHS